MQNYETPACCHDLMMAQIFKKLNSKFFGKVADSPKCWIMILVGMYNDVVNFQLLFLDFNCSRPVEYHAIFSILKQRKKGKTNIVTKRWRSCHLITWTGTGAYSDGFTAFTTLGSEDFMYLSKASLPTLTRALNIPAIADSRMTCWSSRAFPKKTFSMSHFWSSSRWTLTDVDCFCFDFYDPPITERPGKAKSAQNADPYQNLLMKLNDSIVITNECIFVIFRVHITLLVSQIFDKV